jgi:DNA-binding IscR family transcriptional regulator
MLNKLLRQVAQGGVYSTAVLARELDVSEDLLAQMTDDLVRMGYLRSAGGGCGGQCNACELTARCSLGGSSGIWTLTEKARRVTGEER